MGDQNKGQKEKQTIYLSISDEFERSNQSPNEGPEKSEVHIGFRTYLGI